jgi:hypothetical protein
VLLSSFTDEAVRRPEAQAFFAGVTTDDGTDSPTFPRWAEIAVTLGNGQELSRRVDLLRGSAAAPLTLPELRTKVGDCLEWGHARADIDRLFDGALSLDRIPVRQWLAAAVVSPN